MSEEREGLRQAQAIRIYRAAPAMAALMAIDITRPPPPAWGTRASVKRKHTNPNREKQAAAKRARKATRRSS